MAIERDDTAMAFPAVRDSGSWNSRETWDSDPQGNPAGGSTGGSTGNSTSDPTPCPDENLLVQLAEGALDGSERIALDRHLDTCAACSMLVAELARLAAPPARSAPQRYKIVRQLGAGAMGVVWEAEDTTLQRRVALKFVKPEGVEDRALRKRLLREARALAQIRHPNVMALYDAGEADDEVCLVLELITGANARAWRDAAPRTTAQILDVWKQAAAGIAAVHAAGIVHRDIKPDNVFVSEDGRVLVGDFGLATGDGVNTTSNLTVSGAVIGTPLYMSPEQLQGRPANVMSDQFALCASIWEAVVGERPFRGSTIAAVVLAMSKLPEIPKDIDSEQRRVLAVLQRGLDPDPSRRFADVAAVLAALQALDRPARKKRRGSSLAWITAGAVVLAVGGTVAVLAATSGGDSESPSGSSGLDGSAATGSAATGSAATGSAATGSAANGSAANGSAATGSAATGSAGSATGSAADSSAADGSAATGSAANADRVARLPGNPAIASVPSTTGPRTTGPSTTGPSTTGPGTTGARTTGARTTGPRTTGPRTTGPAAKRSPAAVAKRVPTNPTAPGAPAPAAVPAPAPTTVRRDISFTHLMQRAADKLQFGDGAGCLELLAQLPDVPDDQMAGVGLVKIECRMATGACATAAAELRAFGKEHGWSDDRITKTYEGADMAYCPLDAPPRTRWPARAQHRLQVASGLGRSCKPVLDAIRKHHIILPDPKQQGYLEARCMVNDGDCAGAKKKYLELTVSPNLDPKVRPQVEASLEKAFYSIFKTCPSP